MDWCPQGGNPHSDTYREFCDEFIATTGEDRLEITSEQITAWIKQKVEEADALIQKLRPLP